MGFLQIWQKSVVSSVLCLEQYLLPELSCGAAAASGACARLILKRIPSAGAGAVGGTGAAGAAEATGAAGAADVGRAMDNAGAGAACGAGVACAGTEEVCPSSLRMSSLTKADESSPHFWQTKVSGGIPGVTSMAYFAPHEH